MFGAEGLSRVELSNLPFQNEPNVRREHDLMNIHLTFDVEVWCNDWANLDGLFPAKFQRNVYGRSVQGDFALPKILATLNQHGLRGVFFVESLFAARFGVQHLAIIVDIIRSAGHDVQLHVHAEWADEISPPLLIGQATKRDSLGHFDVGQQTQLIGHALQLLRDAGADKINTFRAGSFGCNRDTFRALVANGIFSDSSLNAFYPASGTDLRSCHRIHSPSVIEDVASYPVSTFQDGFGRMKPAQLAGCGFGELRQAMSAARAAGWQEFVLVLHNFDLLKIRNDEPDLIAVRRFESLCRFLESNADHFPTVSYPDYALASDTGPRARIKVPVKHTVSRYLEQLRRSF